MKADKIDILIIEDEIDLREAMQSFFDQTGYSCHAVGSAEEASAWSTSNSAHIMLVDITLPGESGLDWLRNHANPSKSGVIIVSAAGSDADRIAARSIGADGYFIKPVNLAELGITVKNLCNRLQFNNDWELSSVNWKLTAPSGRSMSVTASELAFLESLAITPGDPVDRKDIIERLGESPAIYDMRRMETMVKRLRTKAEETLGDPLPITTVRGIGYAFTARLNWEMNSS